MTFTGAEEKKLKQIDEFAKSLGVTLYNITCKMDIDNKEYLVTTQIFENKMPEKWSNSKFYLNDEQKKKCNKIDLKIRKMNDRIYEKIKGMFKEAGISMGVYHDFSYGCLMSIEN